MANKHRYSILIQEVNEDATRGKSVDFEFDNHDDILEVIEKSKKAARFDNENDNTQFVVGIKLFSEIMLKNKENTLFEEILPAFRDFMQKLKH